MSAPISATSPDTPITVKISYEGNNRRFKLPLKDLGPSIFEKRLKGLLSIPENERVIFERYSDSAERYITLDPNNSPVYKQLFRAAKAKLKLRIIAKKVVEEEKPLIDTTETVTSFSTARPPSYHTVQNNQSVTSLSTAMSHLDLDKVVEKAVTNYCSSTQFSDSLRETIRDEVVKQSPVVTPVNISETTPAPVVHNQVSGFAIYCNNCNESINGEHFHCVICDTGDFDLCKKCTDKGVHCNDHRHWLRKREFADGKIVCVAGEWTPSVKHQEKEKEKFEQAKEFVRLCNDCGKGLDGSLVITCLDCKDYDLCLECFRASAHGHDSRHEFSQSGETGQLSAAEVGMLAPGRNVHHGALCDECDQTIYGVRHKCLDCPDWDYCSGCVKDAAQRHPGHRFVPVYEAEACPPMRCSTVLHYGVYCDGPVCAMQGQSGCIRGVRYKCTICPDTDFCGNCEASPFNKHNATHPLIKMKTAIRHVLVTTTDNNSNVMGDISKDPPAPEKEVTPTNNAATQVQTIADVKPTEEFATPPENVSVSAASEAAEVPIVKREPDDYFAEFVSDTVADGAEFTVGQTFTQTWTMRNSGATNWPAGVSVKFVGGDYMFLKTEEDTLNATVTDREIRPAETAEFSVNLSATWPPSKTYVSYWRLMDSTGKPFGHNIWCSINVKAQETVNHHNEEESVHNDETASSVSNADPESVKDINEEFESVHESMQRSQASQESQESQMIFPKLPVESPVDSVEHLQAPASPVSSSARTLALDDEEVDVSSLGDTDSFLTDEEYDVLDASDEEPFEECERVA